ncbi:glycosyltransferase family 2 protein [Christiangramia flava]|uniref:Glycosyl transferase, family 2 n=1 Tax=Christiangramia flava JLT2011 TaxID=1229726 RepID=A0A1L7I6A2_9FLAO|nr:glycosyltransferase [Christiangramia flava]APU69128.1 Glycosyl transferase, family 2 [Christiangramia flava JLT2011]OSS38271.1 glycosyl transferase, family 2 [Christiangramia flava JLT2011]
MKKLTDDLSFSLIICTYERDTSLKRLLDSVQEQRLYPDEILIIDGSYSKETEIMLEEHSYKNLKYFRVEEEDRGLTKQRNYGIKKSSEVAIICFLDDDIVLKPDYFQQLIQTYQLIPEAIAVGGWIEDETAWKTVPKEYQPAYDEFVIDGYVRKLGQRNVLRKRLGLLSDKPPGFMPEFSHGFSTGFLPPSNKIYEVEYFMGGVSSYKKKIFDKLGFSPYFEGYGLYEDMDFCLRASNYGKLYLNTGARVKHLHVESGRPNHYKYGQMVVKNGKYVWKLKYPKPSFKARLKWYKISFLLAFIRLINYLQGDKAGFRDFKGRLSGFLK